MFSCKAIIVILSIALATTILFGIFAFGFTSSGQNILRRIRAYPQGIQYENTIKTHEFMANSGYSVEVVFLGNSITYEAPWTELFPGIRIANRGIPGDRIEGMIRRLGNVKALSPKKIVIMAGINNLLQNEMADDVAKKYITLIDSASGASELIICSTLMTASFSEINDQVQELNNIIAHYCREKGIVWIDLNTQLAPDGPLQNKYSYDGLHLTIHGYAVWQEMLQPYLLR